MNVDREQPLDKASAAMAARAVKVLFTSDPPDNAAGGALDERTVTQRSAV
jgi:hypothetical protein